MYTYPSSNAETLATLNFADDYDNKSILKFLAQINGREGQLVKCAVYTNQVFTVATVYSIL